MTISQVFQTLQKERTPTHTHKQHKLSFIIYSLQFNILARHFCISLLSLILYELS